MFLFWVLVFLVFITLCSGYCLHSKRAHYAISGCISKMIIGSFSGIFCVVLALFIASLFHVSPLFASEGSKLLASIPDKAYGLAFLGAGLSVGLACIGTGIATGMSASAAIGAVSEDPKLLGTSLLFVGLSEGIAIYGLIIAIMILGRMG